MGLKEGVPFFAMIVLECIQVGSLIVMSKVAINNFIFVLYSNLLASLVLIPSSLLLHTRSQRPPLTFRLIAEMFLLAVLGFLGQNIQYVATRLSSPTLGSALLNLTPGFTFVLAIVFRMEKFNSGSSATVAKSVGTIVMIVGAFAIIYYRGPRILKLHFPSNLSHMFFSQQSNWILGGFLFAAECLMSSVWFILQASVLKRYPAELIVVLFYSVFISFQSAVVCLFLQRNPATWTLTPSIKLIAVFYYGIISSTFRTSVNAWCLRKKGPVFVSMFKPLGIVIAASVGIIWSGDPFYLGSLVGAIVIVFGFYLVIWGKAEEEKTDGDALLLNCRSSNQKFPLLNSEAEEI